MKLISISIAFVVSACLTATSADALSGLRVDRMLTSGLLTDLVPVTGPELVSCLTTFVHLRYCPPEAAPAFARELLQLFRAKLSSCNGPQLADLAWSLAKLKVRLCARSGLYSLVGASKEIVAHRPE